MLIEVQLVDDSLAQVMIRIVGLDGECLELAGPLKAVALRRLVSTRRPRRGAKVVLLRGPQVVDGLVEPGEELTLVHLRAFHTSF